MLDERLSVFNKAGQFLPGQISEIQISSLGFGKNWVSLLKPLHYMGGLEEIAAWCVVLPATVALPSRTAESDLEKPLQKMLPMDV